MIRTVGRTLAVGAAVLLAGTAGESRALDCLRNWFSARTTYAPPYSGPVATTAAMPVAGCCPAPVTAAYVPQTCYRSVVETVPVTSFMPVTTCDPCTGCPRTAFRPTTAMVRQVRLVPYTSYRVQIAQPCNTCAPLNPCLGGACGTPMAAVGIAAPAGCSSCGVPSAPAMVAPALSAPPPTTAVPGSPVPTYVNPAPGSAPALPGPAATPAPSSGAGEGGATGGPVPTFRSAAPPLNEPRISPVPDRNSSYQPQPGPRLSAPDSRTTESQVRPTSYVQLLAAHPVAAAATQEVRMKPIVRSAPANDGWRSAD